MPILVLLLPILPDFFIKSGTRYLTILISGGFFHDLKGKTAGIQFVSKYRRKENKVDEAVYLKYYAFYDLLDEGVRQIRAGVSLNYDIPRINGESFNMISGSVEPKTMWRNRSLYFLALGCIFGGGRILFPRNW